MNRSRSGFPSQSPPVTIELESISKILRLLARSYQLHDREELLVPVVLLLLLQDQHEVEAEAGLHHHPVHSPGQVDVCGEEDDVLPLQGGDGLVLVHQVGHHGVQRALPLAGRAGARAGVRPELTELFVICLFRVWQSYFTPGRGVFTREKD